jgi:hypothetical protein
MPGNSTQTLRNAMESLDTGPRFECWWAHQLGTDRRGSRNQVATANVDDDPTAVSIGDVVEAKKLSRTPTNQRASDLVEHGFNLDVERRESRGRVEESVADFLGLEVSGSPRNECGQQ